MTLKESYEKSKNWGKRNLIQHIVDTTAALATSTPFFAALEVGLGDITKEEFLDVRAFVCATGYLGIGSLFSRGRDLWRKGFNIDQKTKEKVQGISDSVYGALFNAVYAPIIYSVSGVDDMKKLGTLTLCAMGIGAVSSILNGGAIDVYRDLTGFEECKRKFYPEYIKKQSSKLKKVIATGLVASSIGICTGLYGLASEDNPQKNYQSQGIEQVFENNENSVIGMGELK